MAGTRLRACRLLPADRDGYRWLVFPTITITIATGMILVLHERAHPCRWTLLAIGGLTVEHLAIVIAVADAVLI